MFLLKCSLSESAQFEPPGIQVPPRVCFWILCTPQHKQSQPGWDRGRLTHCHTPNSTDYRSFPSLQTVLLHGARRISISSQKSHPRRDSNRDTHTGELRLGCTSTTEGQDLEPRTDFLSIPSKFGILRFQANSPGLLGKPLNLLNHENGLPPLSCSTLPASPSGSRSKSSRNEYGWGWRLLHRLQMEDSDQTSTGCCTLPITQHKSSQI